MEWQPIETAPKPFIEFLGYFCNGDQHVVAINKNGECYRDYREANSPQSSWMMPEKWMKLPPPPTPGDVA